MTHGPGRDRQVSGLPRTERYNADLHDVTSFSCGKPVLDTYIQSAVTRDEEHHTAATYVLVDLENRRRVIGYYTLNSFALPKKQARRRDRDRHLGIYDPVPAVLIGRLALDIAVQGQGYGNALLTSALNRVLAIREQLGVAVVVVHALDETAATFYEHHGFTRFREEPLHLYYPLAALDTELGTGASGTE